jgi:hypothetical protein
VLIVIVGNGRKRKGTHLLAAKAPIVPGDELFPSGSRGEADRASEGRPHAEMRLESPRSGGGLQRPDVHAEFLGKLVERQQLGLSLVVRDGFAGTLQHGAGNDASPAVPRAEGLERDR